MATTTYYEFPARGVKPAGEADVVRRRPPASAAGGAGRGTAQGRGGRDPIGSKGKLIHDTYGLNPRLLPKSLQDSVGLPKQTLPRITTSHEINWSDAAKGKGKASSPFEYAAQLTEVMLLGVVALRAGGKIHYDGARMRVTNTPAANEYLTREYRSGWTL